MMASMRVAHGMVVMIALAQAGVGRNELASRSVGDAGEARRTQMKKDGVKIVVAGSANWDTTIEVRRLPRAGETVRSVGKSLRRCAGGKGLNQAVASARLMGNRRSGRVAFVGRLGCDGSGDELEALLVAEGVDMSGVCRIGESGQGFVVAESNGGQVYSLVVGCANDEWGGVTPADADRLVANADAVLLQREIPTEANRLFAAAAKRAGATVYLDAGGSDAVLDDEVMLHVDWLTPNLTELAGLVGVESFEDEAAIVRAAMKLCEAYPWVRVLATMGDRGSLVASAAGIVRQPALPASRLVDETAAGDAFRAAFAVRAATSSDITDCLRFASAAGALAVSEHGAVPSLPSRQDVDAKLAVALPRGGKYDDERCPWQFASRLNSMKARRDLVHDQQGDNTLGWIARQAQIEGLELVDFNYPQHLKGLHVDEVKKALDAAGLKCGAVCLRYPADTFRKGSFTHPDPDVRNAAIQLTVEAADWAAQLGSNQVCVWSAWDGYDYCCQVDYAQVWSRLVQCFGQVCDLRPKVDFSLEFKPTDENTRYFAVPSTGAALLLARDIDRTNFGLTLDVGHMLAASENPAQSLAMVAREHKLFGVQLNDGYQRIGAEDGLVFASVHHLAALEFVLWLRRAQYKGHVYFDTFPRNEDPVREAQLNIRRVKRIYAQAAALEKANLQLALDSHDALAVLELLDQLAI